MGMMDRDWYQEHWQRNVLGIEKPKGDPIGAPAVAARRAWRLARRVPAGAGPGEFWRWVYCVAVVVGLVVYLLRWWRG